MGNEWLSFIITDNLYTKFRSDFFSYCASIVIMNVDRTCVIITFLIVTYNLNAYLGGHFSCIFAFIFIANPA